MAKPDIAQPEERDRQQEALKLRLAGMSYERIAERLGYADHSGAVKAVQAVLDRQESEAAAELRKLEDARLDLLWLRAFPAAMNGDLKAIETAARIHDRRVKLHGLAAPQKLEVGMSLDECVTRVEDDLRALGLDPVTRRPSGVPEMEPEDDGEAWSNV